MKIVFGILAAGVITGLMMLSAGMYGPTYRTQVAKLPIDLESPSQHRTTFKVDHSDQYMIELHLNAVFPDEKMERILGDFAEGERGEVEVAWKVESDSSVIGGGSNTEFGYSPIWSGSSWGLSIGTVNANEEVEYTLSVFTKNVSSDWNRTDPYVEVGLHPNRLEGFLVIGIYGFLLLILSGIPLAFLVVLQIVRKRRQAFNQSLQPTPENGRV